jgi:hypothetical protein
MRHISIRLALSLAAIFSAAVAEGAVDYHFVPLMNGQPQGNAQFVEVAPVVGPESFKTTLSGATLGSAPSNDPLTAHAYLDKWGLGVKSPSAGMDLGVQGQVQLDSKSGGEFLRLEFPEEVQLTYVTFASVGLTDQFGLEADGQAIDVSALFPDQSSILEISSAQGNWPGTVDFTRAHVALPFAKVWDIFVISGDGFQLENVGVVPVPEPSTWALWLVGLTLIGMMRARRRRATQAS